MTKTFYKSWTFWFALAQLLLGGIGMMSGLMDQAQAWTLLATGAASLGLRFKTNSSIGL